MHKIPDSIGLCAPICFRGIISGPKFYINDKIFIQSVSVTRVRRYSVNLIKRESNYYAISVHVYFIWPVFYYWTLYRPLGSHLAYCPWNLKLPVIYVFTAKLVILILTKSVLVALCLRISLSPLQSQMPSDTAVWSPGQRNLTLSHLWPYLLWILFWLGWFPRLRDLRLRGRRHRLCSV